MTVDPGCWVELQGVAPQNCCAKTATGTDPAPTFQGTTSGDTYIQVDADGNALKTFLFGDDKAWHDITPKKVSAFFGRVPPVTALQGDDPDAAGTKAYTLAGMTATPGEAYISHDLRHIYVFVPVGGSLRFVEQTGLEVGSTYTNIETGNVWPLAV